MLVQPGQCLPVRTPVCRDRYRRQGRADLLPVCLPELPEELAEDRVRRLIVSRIVFVVILQSEEAVSRSEVAVDQTGEFLDPLLLVRLDLLQ